MWQECPFCHRSTQNPVGGVPIATCASCRAQLEQDPRAPGLFGYLAGGPVRVPAQTVPMAHGPILVRVKVGAEG